ncbi:hypothetical protein KY331_03525 [Candidatus Woesearchaeota archaeon]|nr:hypothetical protein [Candidatus Woesearchaeota archaeon]
MSVKKGCFLFFVVFFLLSISISAYEYQTCGGAAVPFGPYTWSYIMGYRFTPNADGQVTELCGYFSGTKTVKVWAVSGYTELGSATVVGNAPTGWGACTPLGTPISLTKGTDYYVGVCLQGSGGYYRTGETMPYTPCNNVNITHSFYYSTSGCTLSGITGTSTTLMYGMADIKFGASAGNTAPTQGTPILNSSLGTNTTNENLTVYNQSTSDAENDTVKNVINWYVNGTSIAVLNMPFEGNNGSENISTKDYSSNGNNGSVTSATWSSTSGYDSRGAYDFDGVNDYINMSGDASLNLRDAITISAWVNGVGDNFSSASRTTTSYDKQSVQFQVVGDKIYYVWHEIDSAIFGNEQIWTAVMNTDGTGWTATQRTTSGYDSVAPQLQVVRDKIYYVWHETDSLGYTQIWTAHMNTDGTGWMPTKRTFSSYNKEYPQMQVVGDKIYYTWAERDSGYYLQIWTGEMNIMGIGGMNATKRTTSLFQKTRPQLHVVGDKIYYTWHKLFGSRYQIETADMYTNGTGWNDTQRTTTLFNKMNPQLQVVGNKIYYTWDEYSGGGYYQIWTAEINTDGTGWTATQRTTTSYNKRFPQMQIVGDKMHFTWTESDWSFSQIWTGEMNINGTGWSATQRTTSAVNKGYPQMQVVGDKIYYAWEEYSTYTQIWTGEIGSNIISKGDFYGIGITNNKVKAFIDAGVDGFKYNAEAINYTAGAAVESTISAGWNYISMTYDKSNLKLYINGNLKGTSSNFTENINRNTFDLIIGTEDFNGSIDEILILNRALSAQQIQALYNNRTDLIVSQETSVGDIWKACITPNDGTLDGNETCSNNLTIVSANQPPIHGTPILNSTYGTNYTTENLTVYNQSTSDPENDTVKNIIDWRLFGKSNAVLNMPLKEEALQVLQKIILVMEIMEQFQEQHGTLKEVMMGKELIVLMEMII